MKKQFNRVKQLANQTVGRAEKTEVLSEDLLQIERRLEVVRLVSHNAHKKLVSCLQGHLGMDVEKRHKKLPLTGLSQAMQDGAGQLGDESLTGKMLELCGEAESKLAFEQSQHEVQLERDILEPINQLAEVDIPNLLKLRKQLAKLVLDYDSARARYIQATKSQNLAVAAKLDSLKDEMDEALNKVEICKDQLSAEMYNFSSKEADYAQVYVMLLEAQAEYHKRSLASIESVLPSIRSQQDSWAEKPSFGTALEDHLKRSGREIALPIEACVMMLLETGMKEEGLFRIAAGASKLKKLKAALDCSTAQLEEFYSDPHAVAGALKSYLRELPEPLMTFQLYDEWIHASNISDVDKRLQALWTTCEHLPKSNKANFRYLIKFLAKLAHESEANKMTPSNIAIILGPNLLWAKAEGSSLAEMAATTSVHVVSIIELVIQHADWFFPDDLDFNVSDIFTAPVLATISPGTPEPDTGSIDRRRPGSQSGSSEGGESPRRDSPAVRRTGTINRKQPHSSPAFQPPLPPGESGGEGPELPSLGSEADQASLLSGQGLQKQQDNADERRSCSQVTRESNHTTSSTSTLTGLRNGPNSAAQSPVQLSVASPAGSSRGPSPLSVRRGTKKQAPAPPRQISSVAPTINQATPVSTPSKPLATPCTGPSPMPPGIPRRSSNSQLPLQAPGHPPPQPPQVNSTEAEPSPPSTPTSPGTPPHDRPSQPGSDQRPRPAPRARPRPRVPPPPQPPTNDICNSASKVITDV
ncbi:rho GTPase-activating protein 17b isoform X2 [Denticeps clupeoides]|uniref:rho GTPase-activating protein 17b isoform X2 n=1 Tax=Denticeps clupeoides TaxID=299321 RepID=UPI0010A51BDA|nr:rho GTPase-activating protein 17-like isoform X2 [Denticeps clupeoides]